MNTYCGGDKGLMKRMIEDIESGKAVGEEVMERYERMRGYLEKKDEQPGEWVYEVSPFPFSQDQSLSPNIPHPGQPHGILSHHHHVHLVLRATSYTQFMTPSCIFGCGVSGEVALIS